jgi:hypothetical protein
MPSLDLRFEFIYLVIQLFEVVKQALYQYTKRVGQLVPSVLD